MDPAYSKCWSASKAKKDGKAYSPCNFQALVRNSGRMHIEFCREEKKPKLTEELRDFWSLEKGIALRRRVYLPDLTERKVLGDISTMMRGLHHFEDGTLDGLGLFKLRIKTKLTGSWVYVVAKEKFRVLG